jgi:hypothetical protein
VSLKLEQFKLAQDVDWIFHSSNACQRESGATPVERITTKTNDNWEEVLMTMNFLQLMHIVLCLCVTLIVFANAACKCFDHCHGVCLTQKK